MREHLTRYRGRKATAALAAVLLATTGCTFNRDSDDSTIQRCYDTPLPHAKPTTTKPKPLTLHYKTRSGTFKERPALSKVTAERLKDGNVRIDDGAAFGSGFITTDSKGQQAVVLSAHEIAQGGMKNITMSDRHGNVRHAKSGCFIFEHSGSFSNLKDVLTGDLGVPPDVDVAILRPDKPFPSKPLKLAAKQSRRGTWLTAVNNQSWYTPESPAVYSALTVLTVPSIMGNVAISGLDAYSHNNGGKDAYTLQPGGSGSLLANTKTGEVTDMAISSSILPIDAGETWDNYRIRFTVPVAPDSFVAPTVVGMVDANTIRTALASPRA